jgi:hypothetical protein
LIIHACSEANFWEKYFSAYFPQVSDFQVWSIWTDLFFVQTRAVLPYADLAVAHPDMISIGLRLASLSLPYIHLCIFIDLSYHVVCFSRGFLPRFWHSLHICSHPMIFIVSSIILLSFCAFRILEYLLGYFLEIGCTKILFCQCAGLIFYALWITALLIFFFGIHLTSVLNTTLFLELIGSNGIFGDISDWFFRNTTSNGSQHSDWQMHPLENWLLLKSDVQFPKVLGFDTWRISLFWAICRRFSTFLLFWILECFCLWILLLCLPLSF